MPTYEVGMHYTKEVMVRVTANSKEEAEEKAYTEAREHDLWEAAHIYYRTEKVKQ